MCVLMLLFVGCSGTETTDLDTDAGTHDGGSEAPRDAGFRDGGTPDAGATCTAGVTDPAAVHTTYGAYLGEALGDVTRYAGIRFAAPPVDELRWAAPAAPTCTPDVVVADTFAPACPQLANGSVVGDEDCLFLNVWTPDRAGAAPVLVFIHGGGNAQGSAGQTAGNTLVYDGVHLARDRGVVVVTIQYRLGALAWLLHDSLPGDGNLGTLDQIAALTWVRENVAAFGGDPSRVTIFGESAGARNVCVLAASPLAAGLFDGLIMESGGCIVPPESAVRMESDAQIADVGCDVADVYDCLMTKTAEDLLLTRPPVIEVAGRSSQLQPYVDGVVLLGQPDEEIAAGRHNHVAAIVGANSDETSTSVPELATEAAYTQLVRAQFGMILGDRVLAQYPAADFPTPQDAYIAVTTDSKFVCGARRDARAFAAGQTEPVYRYFFTQHLENAPRLRDRGAYHGLELFFVFDNLFIGGYRPTAQEEALADTIGGYWSRFAAGDDPNGDGAPTWPAYDAAADRTLVLGDPIETRDGIRTARCDFWDSIF
jgi:para-nitrobenzyl esterase